jgi:hypothetical protein
MSDSNRREAGLEPAINELVYVRERWSSLANQALQEAHVAARIDHRRLEIQGIDREPRPQIPRAAFEMERHGYRSLVADRMRAEYQARLQARLDRAREKTATDTPEYDVKSPAARTQSLEDIRREARQNWLRMRAERDLQVDQGLDEVQSPNTTLRTRDDDLAR